MEFQLFHINPKICVQFFRKLGEAKLNSLPLAHPFSLEYSLLVCATTAICTLLKDFSMSRIASTKYVFVLILVYTYMLCSLPMIQ